MSTISPIVIDEMSVKLKIQKGQEMMEIMARGMLEMLDAHQAVNYVEADFESKEGTRLSVIVCRLTPGAKSPHQLRLEAEHDVQILKERVLYLGTELEHAKNNLDNEMFHRAELKKRLEFYESVD